MGDSAGTTNLSALRGFTELGVADQSAVQWKSEGKNYPQIAALLQSEYGLTKAVETVRSWFRAGGRLEQAFLDYGYRAAESSTKRGGILLGRLGEKAVAKIGELIDSPDDTIALRASGMVADKLYMDSRSEIPGASTDNSPPASSELLAEIEREKEIYRLGEEALATKEFVKDAEESNG